MEKGSGWRYFTQSHHNSFSQIGRKNSREKTYFHEIYDFPHLISISLSLSIQILWKNIYIYIYIYKCEGIIVIMILNGIDFNYIYKKP